MRRGLIIHNPSSGSRDAQRDLMAARKVLADGGWSIELRQTRAAGDAGRLAGAAAEAGLDAVWIAGGDGTINEAVNALVGTPTAIGVLPCGTANVWARQLRLPLTIIDSARQMAGADIRSIDVGRTTVGLGTPQQQTRRFLLWSGLGLDAYITRMIEPRPPAVKRWGVIGYSLAAARAALAYRGVPAHIDIDGQRLDARTILIVASNAELYAGVFHLAPGARIDDGWLDVSVFRGERFIGSAGYFLRALLRRPLRDRRVTTIRARRLCVTASARCDVHVDAEPIGASPVECVVEPHMLRALIPACAPRDLFEQT